MGGSCTHAAARCCKPVQMSKSRYQGQGLLKVIARCLRVQIKPLYSACYRNKCQGSDGLSERQTVSQFSARFSFHKVSTARHPSRNAANPSEMTHLAAEPVRILSSRPELLWHKQQAGHQIARGPRKIRAGRKKMDFTNDNTPSTAMPTMRNGSRISQTKG